MYLPSCSALVNVVLVVIDVPEVVGSIPESPYLYDVGVTVAASSNV